MLKPNTEVVLYILVGNNVLFAQFQYDLQFRELSPSLALFLWLTHNRKSSFMVCVISELALATSTVLVVDLRYSNV